MYPAFGSLYPEGCMELAQVDNEDAIAAKLEPYGQYRQLWDNAEVKAVESVQHLLEGDDDLLGGGDSEEEEATQAPLGGGMAVGLTGVKDITQAFFEHSVKVLEGAFQGQFHYGMCPSIPCPARLHPPTHSPPHLHSHILRLRQAEGTGGQESGVDGHLSEARETGLRPPGANLQKGGLTKQQPHLPRTESTATRLLYHSINAAFPMLAFVVEPGVLVLLSSRCASNCEAHQGVKTIVCRCHTQLNALLLSVALYLRYQVPKQLRPWLSARQGGP